MVEKAPLNDVLIFIQHLLMDVAWSELVTTMGELELAQAQIGALGAQVQALIAQLADAETEPQQSVPI